MAGRPMGVPKTGIFGLLDLVGLDLMPHVARSLLAETDMKVTDVAVACGYASTSHFSKSFRKKYGTSPYRFSHFGAEPRPQA